MNAKSFTGSFAQLGGKLHRLARPFPVWFSENIGKWGARQKIFLTFGIKLIYIEKKLNRASLGPEIV